MDECVLEFKNISKSFGNNQVLFNVDFSLNKGEVHAIIGENGAGKSTMMNIAYGIVKPENGEIYIEGKLVKIDSVIDAQKQGICFVHQEIALCQDISVAQNIFMSRINESNAIKLDYRKMSRDALELLYPLVKDAIDPNELVANLSISNQQVVEIAKALSTECKILILDEPTASLTESETEALYKIMQTLKEKGIGIIYISHRLSEIFEVCDRVTVLRDGHMISRYNVSNAETNQLISDMVGREVKTLYPLKAEKVDYSDDNVLLRVENLSDLNKRVHDISFKLFKGEILGFSGMVGSGRSEIMQTVIGLRRKAEGRVCFEDNDITDVPVKKVFDAGLVYLSEDRKKTGLFLDMSIKQNIVSIYLEQICFNNGWLISPDKEDSHAEEMSKRLNVRSTGITQDIRSLSGGNQQKVLLAKILAKTPKVVILDEPTRGIDVGAKAEIHKLIRLLVEEGIGVIIVSSELNEIVGMCDRVCIIHDGRIVSEVSGDDVNPNTIIYYAAGAYVAKKIKGDENDNEYTQ